MSNKPMYQFMMLSINFIVIFSLFLYTSQSKHPLQYYTNFNDGTWGFGVESVIEDYVTLSNDPKGQLPNDFTVCSSLLIKFMTTKNNFIEIYKEDGTHWFQLDLEHLRDLDTFSERVSMYFEGSINKFWDSKVPINPHTWYQICLGLDTVSGHLRVVVNGHVIVDSVKEFFINTSSIKPKSVAGKFLGMTKEFICKNILKVLLVSVFKTFHNNYWYQSRNTFTNMNIFSYIMSTESMIERTTSHQCDSPGDYLRYFCCKWQFM